MVQKINETGSVTVTESKDVVFTQRVLRNIFFNGENSVSVEFEKISNSGTKTEFAMIPLERFNSIVENDIWDLIDQSKE